MMEAEIVFGFSFFVSFCGKRTASVFVFCGNPSTRMCCVKLTRKRYAIKAVLCRSLFDPFFVAHFACFQSAIVCVFRSAVWFPFPFPPQYPPLAGYMFAIETNFAHPAVVPPPNSCDGLRFYAMPNGVDQKESWCRSLRVMFWERKTKNIGFMFMFPSAQMQVMTWEHLFCVGGCMACDKRECVPTTIWSNRASPIRTHRWGRKRTLWIKACNLPFVFVTRKAKPFLYTAINVLFIVFFLCF